MRMCIHPDCGWVPVLTGPFSYSPNVFGAQVFAREHALCAWWRDEVPVSFKTAVDISRAPILASKLCQGIHTCMCHPLWIGLGTSSTCTMHIRIDTSIMW